MAIAAHGTVARPARMDVQLAANPTPTEARLAKLGERSTGALARRKRPGPAAARVKARLAQVGYGEVRHAAQAVGHGVGMRRRSTQGDRTTPVHAVATEAKRIHRAHSQTRQ